MPTLKISMKTITFCNKTLIETLRFARGKRQTSTDHSTRQRTSSGLHIEQLLRPAAPHHTEKIYELFKQMSLKYTAAPTDRKIILAVYTDLYKHFYKRFVKLKTHFWMRFQIWMAVWFCYVGTVLDNIETVQIKMVGILNEGITLILWANNDFIHHPMEKYNLKISTFEAGTQTK